MAKVERQNNSGRPQKYDPKYTPQLAKWMCRSGLNDEQIAENLGVARGTIYRWKNEFPEFNDALKEPKNFVDSLVEDSLLKRALGFDYEEVKLIEKRNSEGENEIVRIEKTRKMVVPDTTAQIFWLKNRKPDRWRDKPEAGVEDSLVETLSKLADKLPS